MGLIVFSLTEMPSDHHHPFFRNLLSVAFLSTPPRRSTFLLSSSPSFQALTFFSRPVSLNGTDIGPPPCYSVPNPNLFLLCQLSTRSLHLIFLSVSDSVCLFSALLDFCSL
ncbi:unnamed protein product [Protopolystoma xenopodis]|uniref:Uncharacterized protein n=1 Tax=Protopolystoma xenopodis TaxID=117903 RepID=A0A3S5CL32_9PLAT|nr:unnamed protein product [Protopolystoma xenopodis]